VKRGFAKTFAVLIQAWIVYCLFVYPLQHLAQAERIERAELMSCHQQTQPPDFEGCADRARVKAGTDLWTLRAFYTRNLGLLALLVGVIPLLTYAFFRATDWVWPGLMPSS
jgi:hypothetical protein